MDKALVIIVVIGLVLVVGTFLMFDGGGVSHILSPVGNCFVDACPEK
jgi:hypothetical protein